MDKYEQLRQILNTHPATAPKSDKIIEILKILFNDEEISIALTMSFKAKPVEVIAQAAGMPTEDAGRLLENMANKAIIYSHKKDGKMTYGLLPTIPGLFEFPFMKGRGTPVLDRLAVLWEEYHAEALGNGFSGNPTPLMRVIPVEKSLQSDTAIHPYEEVHAFINNASFIAVTQCACRVSVAKCDKPKEVCLIFDTSARFLVERGYARQIDKSEAMKVLDISEKAGLVHTSNNSMDRASLICNCCPCCCTVLRGKTQLKNPHAFNSSRFEAIVSEKDCNGCGICAEERCPAGALSMSDGVAKVDRSSCIGCGLCVTGCPAEAIRLSPRPSVPEIPKTIQEMALNVTKEKGTIDGFVRYMTK